ncbi:hypothetical protein B0A49_09356 [Cryomyces minteri]|uniref:AB hydrolase-1 domain-containing protein n=1 Tax=Cryomyces minteri TaxID=331657 RepID=A0A4U0WUY8_9PEZI|nr:hypothetical protein B0A49_09356 [Cryomyces minteri]
MHAFSLSALALLSSSAAARTCHNITVPVSISSRNGVFNNTAAPQTNLDATTFVQNQTRQGQNFTAVALTAYATVTGNYNISAQFCLPSGSNSTLTNPTVQILTHGIGFDKTYWDLPYNNYNYSYVDTAVDEYGYCTLSYDRLGIGNSSHGEPRNEIQSFLEIQALAAMTRMLRNGSFPTVNHTFSKVVHVGHSFGSAQTFALTAMYPNISDGIILTGWSTNGSFVGYFGAGADFQQANLNQPLRFGSASNYAVLNSFLENYALTDLVAPVQMAPEQSLAYVNGYLTNSNVNSQQYLFFLPPYFDTGLLYYGEQTKQPVTIGELLTLGSLPAMSTFKGPVLVFTGSNDLPYCGGDCLNTGMSAPSIPSTASTAFPNASVFEAYIQPVTGHGLNFHYNATAGYRYIQDFLMAQNLESQR